MEKEIIKKRVAVPAEPSHSSAEKYQFFLFGMLELFCLFLGVNLAFGKIFQLNGRSLIFLYGAAASVFLISTLLGLFLPKKFQDRAAMLPFLLGLLISVFRLKAVRGGMFLAWNRVILPWNTLYEDGKRLFSQAGSEGELLLLLFVFLLFMYTGIYQNSNKKQGVWLVMGIAAVLLTLMAVLQCFSPAAAILLISGILAYWAFRVLPYNDFRRIPWKLFGFLLLGLVCIPMMKYRAPMKEIRQEGMKRIEDFRFGKDSLPEGKLYEAEQLHGEEDHLRLKVTSTEQKTLYLRAFTGDRYQNGVWTAFPGASFGGEDSGILSWLKKRDFHTLSQYADYLEAANLSGAENRIRVVNEGGNRRYLYQPATAGMDKDFAIYEKHDNGYRSHALFGSSERSYRDFSGIYPTEIQHAEEWLLKPENERERSYAEAEKVYRSFVHRHYLEQNPELKTAIQGLFHQEELPAGVYAACVRIRSVMEKELKYTEEMEELPENVDPILHFLTGQTGGNAVFYASAAVEAFRSFGVPARYVEGYYYAPEEQDPDGYYYQELRSKDAHAWCEVYMDGMGWLPVDMTPGYYYESLMMIELMGLPDGLEKTTGTEDSGDGSSELLEEKRELESQAMEEILEKSGSIVYGLFVLFFGLLLLLGLLFGLFRLLMLKTWRDRVKSCTEREFTDWNWRRLQTIFMALGIELRLGYHAPETEELIREKMPLFLEGEYQKLNGLMEGFYYGEQALRPYEMRMLLRFIDKLRQEIRHLKLHEQLRIEWWDSWNLLKNYFYR